MGKEGTMQWDEQWVQQQQLKEARKSSIAVNGARTFP